MTLLLDTGAIRSILPGAFARAHNLTRKSRGSNEHVVDSNGNLAQMPLLADVPAQSEGQASAGTLDFLMNPYDTTVGR